MASASLSSRVADAVASELSQPVSLGTTIMAVEFAGGVVVGADSRTTTGSYVANRVTDKLTAVHERVYVCRSGSAADTQAVADIVRYHLESLAVSEGRAPDVRTAAALFRQIIYANRDALQAGVIVAGWDAEAGGSVYSVPLGGSLHRQPWAIGGSGSAYIYGFCDAEYRPGMSRDECVGFVKRALALAMARDGSSGGVARVAVVTEASVDRLVFTDLPRFYDGA